MSSSSSVRAATAFATGGLSETTGATQGTLEGSKVLGLVPPDINGAAGKPIKDKKKAEDMETRSQDMTRLAAGAGAMRSDNDADLLGFSGGVRKRGVSRALGYG